MRALRGKPTARAWKGDHGRRSAAASGDRSAPGEGPHHRVPVPERGLWTLRKGYPCTIAGGDRRTVWAAIDGADRVLDGRLPAAAAAGGSDAGRCAGHRDQFGQYPEGWEEVSQAVAQPVRQLQEQLPREAILNVDETGWRTNGDKRWIWALVAHQFVFYVVASTRGAEVLVSLLGAVYRGILCSDRWVVYLTYHSGRMQLCWAHLKRNILGIADYARSPSAQQFCRDALAILARLFRLWYRFRGDLRDRRGNPQPLDRRQLIEKSIPLQKKLFALAEAHLDDADREVRNMATALFTHFERLFTFLEHEGVEPTNNTAEQALRTAVQWRKISFGNRSRNGEIATARLLTVAQSCKRQQRHVLDYLTDAVRCHRRQTTAPSLLP